MIYILVSKNATFYNFYVFAETRMVHFFTLTLFSATVYCVLHPRLSYHTQGLYLVKTNEKVTNFITWFCQGYVRIFSVISGMITTHLLQAFKRMLSFRKVRNLMVLIIAPFFLQ